jgi:hypothetical protein
MSSFPYFDFVDSSHLGGLSLFSHSVVAHPADPNDPLYSIRQESSVCSAESC